MLKVYLHIMYHHKPIHSESCSDPCRHYKYNTLIQYIIPLILIWSMCSSFPRNVKTAQKPAIGEPLKVYQWTKPFGITISLYYYTTFSNSLDLLLFLWTLYNSAVSLSDKTLTIWKSILTSKFIYVCSFSKFIYVLIICIVSTFLVRYLLSGLRGGDESNEVADRGDVIGPLLEPVRRGQWSARTGWREGCAEVFRILHNSASVPQVIHFVSAECAMLCPHPCTTYHLTSSVQAENEAEAL